MIKSPFGGRDFFLLLFLFCFAPTLAQASGLGLSYSSLVSSRDGQIVVSTKDLGTTDYYLCDLKSLSCKNSGSTAPNLYPKDFANRDIFISPNGRYAYDTEFGVLYEITADQLKIISQIPLGSSSRRRVYWTPDSARIVFFLDSKVVTFDVKTDRNVYKKDWTRSGVSYFTISPTGRYVAFYTGKPEQRIFEIIDLQTNKSYTQSSPLQYWDLMEEEPKLFAFSTDEKRLVYLDDRAGDANLYEVRLDTLTGQKFSGRQIFRQPGTVADFIFTDNNTIHFIANRGDRLTWNLHRYRFSTNRVDDLISGVSYGQQLKRVGDYLVFALLRYPGTTIQVLDLKTSEIKVLAGLPKLNTKIMGVKNESLSASNLKGALWLPETSKDLGMAVIWLHGGPYRQTSLGYHPYLSYGSYDWIMERLVRAGVPVLRLDYSGSYGYGRPFAETIRYTVGSSDVQDVVAAQKYLVAKGYKNIYLMGNSYGGYLSLRSIVGQSKLFAGAMSINGVTDWTSLLGNVPSSIFGVHFGGDTITGRTALYFQASIFDRLAQLGNQPVLLFHSEADTMVSPKQSTTLASLMKEEGKNVTLTTYPGQDHTFSKPEPIKDICRQVFGLLKLKTKDCR